MDSIINLYANATGLWKRIAAILPLIAGAGSVLVGAGNIALALAHSSNAAAALHFIGSLGPSDPNVLLIGAGLTALGVHTNHSSNVSQLADHAQQLDAAAQPPQAQGETK